MLSPLRKLSSLSLMNLKYDLAVSAKENAEIVEEMELISTNMVYTYADSVLERWR